MASAIQQGGKDATQAYSAAFAQAAAAGGDQAKGLAQATAVVFCEGGASAEAYAEALSISISTGGEILRPVRVERLHRVQSYNVFISRDVRHVVTTLSTLCVH